MIEKNGRFYLKTKIPINIRVNLLIWTTVFGGVFIWANFLHVSELQTQATQLEWNKSFFAFLSMFAPLLIFQVWLNKAYKISYDADAVYMTDRLWRWKLMPFPLIDNIMRYDEIADMATTEGNANIQPFEYIPLRREGGEWEERFFISRIYCDDDEIRELLHFMHGKIPDKFPPELIGFMNDEPIYAE